MVGILDFMHTYYYTIKLHIALFDGGSYWKVHLFQFSLILNISLGVLTTAVQMVHRNVLSHRAQASLRQFFVDLVHSLWLIGYLIQTVTYPGTSIQIA